MLNPAANLGLSELGKSRDNLPPTLPLPPHGSRAGYQIGLVGMIWAEDNQHRLGANGGMLWHVPADFKHFKQTTLGWPVIMGRVSFLALSGALPQRRNIILSSSKDFDPPGATKAPSLEAALQACTGSAQVWITGGALVYQEAMDKNLADLLVVSELDISATVSNPSTVAYAPSINPQMWNLDPSLSDSQWRQKSGDARWRVRYYWAKA